ncbi:MAG: pyridoxal-phosphate dependent enzyme [Saprospiraceae bacterium]|nr:pyridoxal-phosphate dependent enzyme [Saprospiraceae bacterium]
MKRDDLLHPQIQGSKARKLAPVLAIVKEQYPDGLLTFGGAFSNHLHAVAVAGRIFQIPTLGILRGAYVDMENPTLKICQENGMKLIPVRKTDYKDRKQNDYQYWAEAFPRMYILPEGGNTIAGVEQCMHITQEILAQLPEEIPGKSLHICTPAGTGCTAAGIAAGMPPTKGTTWIFPVSEDGLDVSTIMRLLPKGMEELPAIQWMPDYMFGGFARWNQEVVDFSTEFHQQTGIMPDPVYTGKMLFGIFDLLAKGAFEEGSTVVALHTGGQQGWDGFRERFGARILV